MLLTIIKGLMCDCRVLSDKYGLYFLLITAIGE